MKRYVLSIILSVVFVVSGGNHIEGRTEQFDSGCLPACLGKEEVIYAQSDYDSVIVMLKLWEGFRPTPYEDLAGGKVTGYGHMIRPGEDYLLDTVLTESIACEILHNDYNYFIDFTYRITGLEGRRLLALSALLFNTGEGKLLTSGLYRSISGGCFVDIENEWLRWCHYRKDGEVVRSSHLLQRRVWEVSFYKECDDRERFYIQDNEVVDVDYSVGAGVWLPFSVPFPLVSRNDMYGSTSTVRTDISVPLGCDV